MRMFVADALEFFGNFLLWAGVAAAFACLFFSFFLKPSAFDFGGYFFELMTAGVLVLWISKRLSGQP